MSQQGMTLNVGLKSGETVKIEITGYSDPKQAVAVLATIGDPDYLLGLWQGINDDEGWGATDEDGDR
ncbi:hypothetical protein [Rhodococcus ruber]|uniref:hypothetical protein n=1 Tax=Rhodococcus ruber TaxID=1830 RepID=UPI00378367D0